MKKMNYKSRLGLATVAIMVATVFVACDKGNGNGNDNGKGSGTDTTSTGGGGTNGGGTGGGGTGNGNSNLVSRIILDGDETFDYTYDAQNRVTAIKLDGEPFLTFTYTSNTVRVGGEGSLGEVYTLNSDGSASKCEISSEKYTENFEYENGYLKKITTSEGRTFNCTWSDGNLVSVGNVTYTYGTDLYKEANVTPYTPLIWGEINDCYPSAWRGKRSKNLPTAEGDETYRYETNANGYVTKVYTRYKGGKEELLWEIQYK
jgi:hypothetical protein